MALSTKADLNLAVKKGPTCSVCTTLAALPKEDAAVLIGWLKNPAYAFTVIAQQTADDPDTPTLRPETLSRHARGQCDAGVRLRPDGTQ